MRQLLQLNYEIAKEKLVAAAPEDMPQLQGRARAFEEMYRQMTRPVPDENQE